MYDRVIAASARVNPSADAAPLFASNSPDSEAEFFSAKSLVPGLSLGLGDSGIFERPFAALD